MTISFAAEAAGFDAFGPRVYLRNSGQPVSEVDTFTSIAPGSFTLHIYNGGLEDDEFDLVSSSVIYLNGVQVLSPNELNQNVDYIQKTVTLQAVNEISVEVRGKPGGALVLNIEGDDSTPPTISAEVTPLANANGWHSTDPTVSFVCGDIGSAIASCSSPVTVTSEGAGQVVTGTAVDLAGNSTSVAVTINLDKSAPSLGITSPVDGTIFDTQQVTVSGQAIDTISPLQVVVDGGIVAVDGSGNFMHTLTLPEGANTISIVATDAAGNQTAASIDVLVVLNQPPVASNQSIVVDEDNVVAIVLTATDPNGDQLNYTLESQPSNGTLTGVAPNLEYTPNVNFNGTDSFSFKASDDRADSNIAIVSIQVDAINDAPQAVQQSLATSEDVAIDVLLSGFDIDADPLNYSIVGNPSNGQLGGTPPNLIYTPNPDFNGADSFSFIANDGSLDSAPAQVTIDVAAVDDAPSADSQVLSTDEDVALAITLTAADVDGDTLSYSVVTQPANGSLSGTAPDLTYTPDANFNGSDSFTFRASDGTLDSNLATVSIGVIPVNDAPVAGDEAVSTSEDTPRLITLNASDRDGDALDFRIVANPANGLLTGSGDSWTYSPGANFNGLDQFSFVANDGNLDSNSATVTIQVTPVNDMPTANAQALNTDEDTALSIVLDGADVDGDALTFAITQNSVSGALTGTPPNLLYTPNPDFNGADRFQFTASDSELTSLPVEVVITVNAVNDAPLADSQTLTTAEDVALSITLSGQDVDGTALSFIISTPPANGSISGTPPNISYQPEANYFGSDQIGFTASDGSLTSGEALIEITVTEVNDAPVIDSSPILVGAEGVTYQYQVDATDPDDSVLAYTLDTAPAGMSVSPDGFVSWTPGFDEAGDYAVELRVTDGQNASVTQSYTLSVSNSNRAPQITSIPISFVVQGDDWIYQLEATDPDGDGLTFSMDQSPAGAVFDPATASVNWPSAGVAPGNYDFEFGVTDSAGGQAVQLATIEVLSTSRVNTHEGTEFWIPVTINDLYSANTGTTFDINLVSNGADTVATLEIPLLGIAETLPMTANQMTTYSIDAEAFEAAGGLDRNTLLVNHAIHITSATPIAAYLMNQKASTTDGFLGLPTASLGKEYIAASYIMLGRLGILKTVDGGQLGSMVTIVATEDDTQVTIDAIMDILPGDQSQIEVGNPIELIMNRGDVYNLETRGSFKADLTGSMIRADKPIAVIGQMECVHVPVGQTACDHLVEQLPPIESLATDYYTVPFWGRTVDGRFPSFEYGDTFRAVAPYNDTDVYIDGVLRARLNQGEYFEYLANQPRNVSASRPVLLMQYSNGNQYDEGFRELENDFADPFMVIVPPAEQFLNQYTVNTPARNLAYNFANLLVPTSARATLTVDGQAVDQSLFSEIPNSSYSYAQLPLAQGSHHIEAQVPFGIYVYGYDFFESYGYLGGMAFSPASSVASLSLSADPAQTLDNQWCADATVVDAFDRPVNGARIAFNVTGVSDRDSYLFSDEHGIARYCYQANQPGVDTVTASLGLLNQSSDVNWLAGTLNRAPVINSLPDLQVVDLDSFSYDVMAVDPDGDSLVYTLIEAPNGMSIDSTGRVSWPQVFLRGSRFSRPRVVLSVSDPSGLEARQSFELSEFEAFNTPPEFEPATPDLTATLGVPYIYNIEQVDRTQDYLKYQVLVDDVDEDAVFVDILSGPPEAYIQRILAFNTQITRPNDPRSCVGCIHYLRWFPETLGEQFIELGLRDARGGSTASRSFTVDVAPNLPPQIVSFNPPAVAAVGNQYSYVVNVDNDVPMRQFSNLDDLKIVFDEAPSNMRYELVPGSGTQLLRILWTPLANELGTHNISFRVEDRLNSSASASFSIEVIDDNQPPVLPFANLPNAEATIPYQYQVVASDPDGDALTYGLLSAPAGMTIDAVTGVIDWIPAAHFDNEQLPIRLVVTDSRGLTAEAPAFIFVAAFRNRAPTFVPAYRPTSAKVGIPFAHQVQAIDREGDLPITYRLSSPRSGAAIDALGNISWTPTTEGRVLFAAQATDSLGNFASANTESWFVDVLPATAALDAELTLAPGNVIDPGETAVLQVTPINAASSVQVSLTVDGVATDVDLLLQAAITPSRVGRIPITAVITDGVEAVTRSIDLFVRDPADNTPPEVQIHSPANVSTISAPTDIIGTVTDDNLTEVLLAYKPANEPLGGQLLLSDFTILYQGGETFVSQAIASLDTSMLLNGTYHILLQATDSNDNTNGRIVSVNVDGDLKVGNFSITLEDLDMPLAGIPITVSRTYDSRRRHEELDFGYGWSIDYQNVRLQESDEPTRGWTQTLSPNETYEANGSFFNANGICIDPAYDKSVTVTLPNGDVEKFIVSARPTNGLAPAVSNPNCYLSTDRTYDLIYLPVEGTQSTLVAENDDSLFLAELENGYLAKVGEFVPEPITNYTLTTRTGFVYELDQDFGVESITDPNGHSVTFSDTGIVHSSGKAVSFIRDAEGQITSITDPAGNAIVYAYDVNGDLESVTDRSLAASTYSYDSDHGLVDLFDALGRRLIRNIYDLDGRLIAQEDSDGNITSFNHDLVGRVSIVTNRRGFATQYQYDDRGNVLTEVDALGNSTQFVFDANDNELSKTDALGNVSSATYNADDDQLTQTDELGNTVGFTYNDLGQELTVTDARGNVFTNVYDSVGNLVSNTDPQGNQISNTYLGNTGLPLTVTDALGNTTQFTYDGDGNKLTETDALGNTTTFTYDDNNNVLSESRSRTVNSIVVTETTTYAYDNEDRLVSTTDALGNETRTEYDAVGNEIAMVDALGRRTEMGYDAYGRLVETRYPDGSIESKSYDAEGNLATETDRLGRVTVFEYDALNRLISTTLPDGSVTRTEYDALGRVTAEIDANGNRTSHEHDAAGRRIKTTDAMANVHQFSFDVDGNLINETDALNHTTVYSYDSLDRKTRTTFADGSFILEEFDALSRRTAMTDQAGIVTRYGYDALGRLVSVTDARLGVTAYAYDEAGNKLTQTDAEGRTTSWTYDALGRLLTRTLPLGQAETMVYDAVGNLVSKTDFNGDVTSYSYDVNDRATLITYGKDGSTESFTYDAVGNRLTATNNQGSWTYVHDSLGRLVSESQPGGDLLEYGYDAQGNRTSLTITYANASVRTETFAYDALNRLQSVTDNDGNLTAYGYDAVGNRSSVSYQNGSSQTYIYDDLNRLVQLSHFDGTGVLINQYDYTLHPTGRREVILESTGRRSIYTYDGLYRLTVETIIDPLNGGYTAEYAYDRVGNRTQSIINGVTTVYSYDDNDRLIQQGLEIYSYDAMGNTLTKGDGVDLSTFTYDAKQQLATAVISEGASSTSASYRYNPDGIRVGKTENTVVTDFLVDSNQQYAQVVAETDTLDIINVEYTHGDDLIKQKRGANSFNYLYDGLGSTRTLTGSDGNASDQYYYDAFGKLLASSGLTANDYLFTGEQYDQGLDNYYLRARYYDQSIGRFTQMDTWMGVNNVPITLHKYLYANADPVLNIDPTGKYTLASVGVSNNIRGGLTTTATNTLRTSVNKAITATLKTVGRQSARAVKMIRTCLKKKDNCRIAIPTLIIGSNNRTAAQHIRNYQKSGRGFVLTYMSRKRSNFQRKMCPGINPLLDCDEYPFQRTVQWGNGKPPAVSYRAINRRHNRSSGAYFGVLVRLAKLRSAKTESERQFLVLAPKDVSVSAAIPVIQGKGK
ncbi:MAG: Ig-like domain-containing protein [Gammaproteobacteria bacterium]|nr:Ig-like domain-containing protein [Gammaproteobacteria bacterium]